MDGQRDAAKALSNAVRLHQCGRVLEAAEIYAALIESGFRNGDAMHLLGIIRCQQGNYDEAVRLIEDAIVISESPLYHCEHVNAARV